MSFFKKADKTVTEVYTFGEEGDDQGWIRVRSSLSKAEANEILFNAPTEQKDLRGGITFLEKFFGVAVVDWNYEDEDGNPVPVTLENYRDMDASAATLVQNKLSEHLNKLLGKEVEEAEGESSS